MGLREKRVRQRGETSRNGIRAASPQHNSDRIALYLPFVYYYLVGTTFETGTRGRRFAGTLAVWDRQASVLQIQGSGR